MRYGYFVRTTAPDQQVIEILRRFDRFDAITPFRRCIRCNGVITPVAKADIMDQVLPQTRAEQPEFRRCNRCGQIYWSGSHVACMQQFVEQVRHAQRHMATDEDAANDA